MPKQSQQEIAELETLLEELRKQLLDASIYFDILEQIWPTAQVVDVINRYKGFFLPVRKALFDQFSIKICRAATRGVWSFNPVQHNDASSLLNHLGELRIIHKKQIEKLRSTIKS